MTEKISYIQSKFWLKMPVEFNRKTKQFYVNSWRKCLAWYFLLLLQLPVILYNIYTLLRELLVPPDFKNPHFTFLTAIFFIFGVTLDICVVSLGIITNIYSHEICTLVNLASQFFWESYNGNQDFTPNQSTGKKFHWNHNSCFMLVINLFLGILLLTPSVGFILPFLRNVDPLYYLFLGTSYEHLIKYPLVLAFRCGFLGTFSYLCCFNVCVSVLHYLICLTYGYTIFSCECYVNNENGSNHGQISFNRALSSFRRLQIFSQQSNNVLYYLMPMSIGMILVYGVECGYLTIKCHILLPLNMYIVFPVNFVFMILLLHIVIPLTNHIYDDFYLFKNYWAMRMKNRMRRKELESCRSLRVEVGPFGICKRSVTLTLTGELLNYLCTAIISIKI
ncbi:unnamed protein product [Orchesella dallaii]|uniref:Odorant receptor n=1 Tax=Orchesella dallaii TaxID=48710 RepID=A0ABP1SAP3_9HEXA